MKRLLPVFILVVMTLAACSTEPSDRSVNPTIAETQSAEPINTTKPTDTPLLSATNRTEPTATPSPTATPTTSPTPTIAPTPIHPRGEIIRHAPNEASDYVWFSYLPDNFSTDDTVYILINGFQCCCPNDQDEGTRGMMNSYINIAEKHKYALLFPAIPRNCGADVDDWVFHFPDYVFTSPIDHPFYRIDLKVNAMIDELISMLEEEGYTVHKKVFLFGWSIDSHFANRYSLLQPHRVEAFAAGGTAGEITIPVEVIVGVSLDMPLGVGNFDTLVGEPFKVDLYMDIPQMFFWGEQDLEHYHLERKEYQNWKNYWGKDLVTALRKQCAYLQSLEMEVTCKEYPGVEHEFTPEMQEDIFKYFEQFRD